MPESESGALPLGDTPIVCSPGRTTVSWLGYEDSNLGMPESESGALPLGDTPTNFFTQATSVTLASKYGGYDGIRTCDPIIMSDVL